MRITKKEVIESFYKIFCTSTTQGKDEKIPNNDYFKRRILGFKAELEFEKEINTNFKHYKFLEGGQFATEPLDPSKPKKASYIYTSFDYLKPREYLSIYKRIANWPSVREMTYVQILKKDWDEEKIEVKEHPDAKGRTYKSILKPKFIFYRFDKDKQKFIKQNSLKFSDLISEFKSPQRRPSVSPLRGRKQFEYLKAYRLDVLKKVYATRYFMDYKKREKTGMNFLDLDGFLINLNKKDDLKLIEVKEKSPDNKCIKATKTLPERPRPEEEWKYGWDTRRLAWYQHVNKSIDLPVIYVVRQIHERYKRKFVQWDAINIDSYLNSVNWSSEVTGGGSSGTLMVPYLHFQKLEKVI